MRQVDDRPRRAATRCLMGVLMAGAAPATVGAQTLPIGDIVGQLVALDARVTVNSGAIVAINADIDARTQLIDGLTVSTASLFDRADATDAALRDVNARLGAQAANAGAIDARVGVLTGRVAGQDAALLDVNARIGANLDAIGAVGTAVDGLAGRVDAQGDALTAVGTAVEGLAGRVAAQGDAIIDLNARAGNTVAAVAALGGQVGLNSAAIADITGTLGAVDLRLTGAEGALVDLDVRVADTSIRVGAVDARVTRTNVRIEAVVTDLGALDQHVTSNTQAITVTSAIAVAARGDAAGLRDQVNAGTIGLVQQQGAAAPVTVAAASGGGVVGFAGTDGNRRLTGIAAGTAASDAATLGQVNAGDATTLAAATGYTDQRIATLANDLGDSLGGLIADNNRVLRKDMNAVAAGTSALAGLPQSIVPGRGMMGAAIGGRGEEVAFALGLSKAFDGEHVPVVKAGAAIDARRGTVSYNAAVGIHF